MREGEVISTRWADLRRNLLFFLSLNVLPFFLNSHHVIRIQQSLDDVLMFKPFPSLIRLLLVM